MNGILKFISAGELATWITAGFLLFFHLEYTFAEAVSYAMAGTLMLLSFIFQAAFITGFGGAAPVAEIVVSAGAIFLIVKRRRYFRNAFQVVRFVVVRHPLASISLLFVIGFMAYRAFAIPPGPEHGQILAQTGAFGENGSFFLQDGPEGGKALLPLNTQILSYLFLRGNTAAGTGLIGFVAYLCIGFSTYALSRRYAWPPTAFTVTLAAISMPRFVLQAATPGQELVPAAAALFCILAIYRCLEQPDFTDLILLLLGISFTISGTLLCLALPAILLGLSCVLFFRRHGKTVWVELLIKNWKIALVCLLPLAVFSQAWLFTYNVIHYGGWLGPEGTTYFPMNANVILGALANVVRYFFESIHPTFIMDRFFQWAMGFSPMGLFQSIYNVIFAPLFGQAGAAMPFRINWTPNELLSWFGPFGFLLVIPGILMSLFRGNRRTKAISIALAGYVYIVALVAAWAPGNAGFFTPVFACGAFLASFILPPWRLTKTGKNTLELISILLLIYSCLFSLPMKPYFFF